jgi:hypothetical protein
MDGRMYVILLGVMKGGLIDMKYLTLLFHAVAKSKSSSSSYGMGKSLFMLWKSTKTLLRCQIIAFQHSSPALSRSMMMEMWNADFPTTSHLPS